MEILIQYICAFPEKCHIDLIKKAIRLINIPDSNEREVLASFLKTYSSIHPDQTVEILKILDSILR